MRSCLERHFGDIQRFQGRPCDIGDVPKAPLAHSDTAAVRTTPERPSETNHLVVGIGSSSGVVSCSGEMVEVEAAGGVEGFFGAAGGESAGQGLVLVFAAAGQVEPEAPVLG
jgi:hypothetical protein